MIVKTESEGSISLTKQGKKSVNEVKVMEKELAIRIREVVEEFTAVHKMVVSQAVIQSSFTMMGSDLIALETLRYSCEVDFVL